MPPAEADDDDVVVIPPMLPPLASGGDGGHWALWNLILSVAGALLAIMMCIRVLLRKKHEDEENEYDRGYVYVEDEEEEKKKRGRLLMIVAIPILAIVALILFILTQDMRQPMFLTDRWTIVHIIIFIAGLLCYIFAYKRDRDEEDDDGNFVIEEASPQNGNPIQDDQIMAMKKTILG